MRSFIRHGIHEGISGVGLLALALAGLVGLSGCGSGQSTDATSAVTPSHAARKIGPAPEALSPYMVMAVPVQKPGAAPLPIQLRFELQSRPQPGSPVDVDLAIVAQSAALARVSGKVEAEDGLTLVEGGEIAAVDKPNEGAIVHHQVRVVPARDGIFSLTATIDVESAGQTASGTFAIPLIAGSGFSNLPVKPDTSPAAVTGAAPQAAQTPQAQAPQTPQATATAGTGAH